MSAVVVAREDPRADEIVALLEAHLALMRRISPPGHVHALDVDALAAPDVTFLTARADTSLLGVGALKQLDDRRAEIKSMHIAAAARGRGVARRLVDALIALAIERRSNWIGLETGTQPEFEPARSLYRSFGFEPCQPFDDYTTNPFSTCMSIGLSGDGQVVATGS